MVELSEKHKIEFERQSSKGNQLKWQRNGIWYKADFCGYEGLAEYVVSNLLKKSSLEEDEYLIYNLEQIKYKNNTYNGVCSQDFLSDSWQIITLERFYKNHTGMSLYETTWHIHGAEERIKYLINQIERFTGINNFGMYMSKLLTIDALFLNEDRHFHNVALLMNDKGKYKLCPIFDNGASLLSDTIVDYPLGMDIYDGIDLVQSKTICSDFNEQLVAVENVYGQNISFSFTKKDVRNILDNAGIYSGEIVKRVEKIIYEQMRKYEYLFS